ncbi:hypothetical protein ABZ341_07225 [Streptomyces sp. NPDC006173]|uniref:hypothetical protein n=1 Tax=Streptomyces sp. NPDC006173 TaxID=3155349 RepID=UPI0034045985
MRGWPDGDAGDKGAASKKPAAKTSSAAQEGLKPLTEAQLTTATITKADVKGYRVGNTPDDETRDGRRTWD